MTETIDKGVLADGRAAVTVVIPIHNNADTVIEQLDALDRCRALGPRAEIVVVDNRSTDGLVEVVRNWHRDHAEVDLRVVDAPSKAGEPYARNVGLAAATTPFVVYCDGDDVVGDTWVAAMHRGLQEHDFVTGPVSTERLNDAWIADVRGQAMFTGRQLLHDRVPMAHGCNMGFRVEVLEALGGFDEDFLAGCDQVISIRAWQHQYELAFLPDAVVHYRLRTELSALARQGRSYGRARVRARKLIPELVDVRAVRRARMRRVGWLGKHAIPSAFNRVGRAEWTWVASQLAGELEGDLGLRRG